MAEGGTTLEYTPTWVVAFVCSVIVFISLAVERVLHYTGKYLKRKNQKPLFEALQKIKEELMLLGFISLLLTVSQGPIEKICISEKLASNWLPCKKETSESTSTTAHFQTSSFFGTNYYSQQLLPFPARRLLEDNADSSASNSTGSCSEGKVPLLSTTALHHLHIFIFVLAVVHVTFCVLTIIFGGAKIRQWKQWEDSIVRKEYNPEEVLTMKFTDVQDHDFIRGRFLGIGKNLAFLGWLIAFFKQFHFHGSVTKTDYMTMRLGFIKTHCKGNPNFNFHKYMVRALEADFKRVVGIRWYLWFFVVIFLLLNVSGWHAYFWVAFVPLFLLLAVGTKLEHVIIQLAHDVAEKHIAIEGDLVVQPSDDHFWFHRPRLVLVLIHIILFQNSFELAFFFWIWIQYSFDSCIMGKVAYIIPRLIIGAFVQFVCSYSTLPLYAIVTQMGTSFKMAIFEEHIQEGLVGWAKSAKKHQAALRKASNGSSSNGSSQVGHSSKYIHKEEAAATTTTTTTTSSTLELAQVESKESSVHVREIQPHQLPPASDHV